MSNLDFVAFDKIERLKGIAVTITEKIHGTNAQIAISDDGQTIDEAHFAGAKKKLFPFLKAVVAKVQSDSGVEQLVARLAHNQEVAGSSPAPATNLAGGCS